MTPDRYEVSVARGAVKATATFSASMQRRIWDAIDDLAADPRHPGCKALVNRNAWRKRVGDYRILYEIHDQIRVVAVVEVDHRRQVYRQN